MSRGTCVLVYADFACRCDRMNLYLLQREEHKVVEKSTHVSLNEDVCFNAEHSHLLGVPQSSCCRVSGASDRKQRAQVTVYRW